MYEVVYVCIKYPSQYPNYFVHGVHYSIHTHMPSRKFLKVYSERNKTVSHVPDSQVETGREHFLHTQVSKHSLPSLLCKTCFPSRYVSRKTQCQYSVLVGKIRAMERKGQQTIFLS